MTSPITDNPPTIVEQLRNPVVKATWDDPIGERWGFPPCIITKAADLIDELTGALQAILLYVDPEGEGTFDGARELAGIKSTGEMVLKGSFIAVCSRAADVLAKAGAR